MPDTFLTIITPTYKRPLLLAANKATVAAQSCRDYVQLIMADTAGYGIDGMFQHLAALADQIRSRYVYVLCDDDIFIDVDAVSVLRTIARCEDPEVMMFKAFVGSFGILPSPDIWEHTVKHGKVDLLNYVVRTDVWRAHAEAFTRGGYAGDWTFIEDVFRCGHKPIWVDRVFAAAFKTSHGRPE